VSLRPVLPVGADGLPTAGGSIDLDAETASGRLEELYAPPGPDWVRLNLIGSVNGSAAGSDGTSETLTNPTDRAILRTIRDLSDVVVIGAASVRAEGYYIPQHSTLAVVTGTGDFSGHRVRSAEGRAPLLVLCPASASVRAAATLGATPHVIAEVPDTNGRLTPGDIHQTLRAAGYRSVVCEGGPSLAAQFVDAGVLDELCLTTAPILTGAALPLFAGHPFAERALRLTQLLVDDAGFQYSRWSLRELATTGR
jgi:riboflavin biosynthesis pyrimidine reductase